MMRDWFNDRFRGRTVTREATVQTPLRLVLQAQGGGVRIKGIAGTKAIVRAQIESRHRDDDGDATELVAQGITFEGDWLSIESPSGRDGVNVHYELNVPFATLAHLSVQNGPVEVVGIDGPMDVKLSNGPLNIEEVGGAVEVELRNGPMRIRACRGALEASVSNGPIAVEGVAGPLDLNVHNGPVSIEDAAAAVTAKSHNGPIAYSGAIRGDFDLRSTRGPIVMDLPGNSRFELDAEADRGEVHCEFDVKDAAGSANAPVYRIFLRSERGDVVIKQSSRVGVS